MLADIAIGVVSNVVYGGLAKVFGMTAVSAQRKVAVERALSNPKDERSKKFRRAMDDLEKVLAHRFGAHTQALANFLAELNRSAFPEVLTEAILTANDDSGARHLFESILNNYTFEDSQTVTTSLFDGISVAVKAQYDLLSQDSEILNLVGNQTRAIQTKLDALNKATPYDKARSKETSSLHCWQDRRCAEEASRSERTIITSIASTSTSWRKYAEWLFRNWGTKPIRTLRPRESYWRPILV